MHGMGDHDPLSAQGSAQVVEPVAPVAGAPEADRDPRHRIRGVELFQAPIPPQHPVQMLAWTRSSRARVPLMWYFALPYTLINVAGFMRSTRPWMRKPQAVLVWLWGAFAIVGTFLWATLAAETALSYLVPGSARVAGSIAAAVIAVLMIATMWWRTRIRPRPGGNYGLTLRPPSPGEANPAPRLDRTLRATWWLHAVVLALVAGAVIAIAPATNADSRCVLHAATPPDCVIYLDDWVTIFALSTAALSAVLVLICVVANLVCDDRTWSNTAADPLMAMAVLLALSLMAVNLGWSAAVMAVRGAMSYLGQHTPWIDTPDNVKEAAGLLRPTNDFLYGPDLVVGCATVLILLGFAIVAGVGVWLLIRRVRRGPAITTSGPPGKWPKRFKTWEHAVICDERRIRLTAIVLGFLALFTAAPLWVILGWFPGWEAALKRTDAGKVEGPVVWTARVSEVAVDALLVSILIALLIPAVRRPFAVVGDIAGYWDMKWHALAALPYRGDVVKVLVYEIERAAGPYVLVGHSQGSILAFTAVKCAQPPPGETKLNIHLVTCGSPLLSLYSRFFPFYFDTAIREEVANKVIEWGNFWRDSDPIGCPLFGSDPNQSAPNTFDRPDPSFMSGRTNPVASEVAIVDPAVTPTQVDDPSFGHSDYWLVPAQKKYLDDVHNPAAGQS